MIRLLLAGLSHDTVELHLAAALREAGHDVRAIVSPGSPAVAWCRDHSIPFRLHEFRHRFDRRAVALYRELLRDHPRDILHAFTNRALSTALLATRRLERPPRLVGYRGTMGHLSRWDPASRLSYLHPRVNAIVCVSDAVRRYLLEFNLPESRLAVIWKGHELSWYTPAPRAALDTFGIPPDATTVAFVGNIRPVKGVNILLDAFETLSADDTGHLLLFGEVRDPKIRRRMNRHSRIHFLGFQANAAELAGACDIAVMPSIEREGLPKAILEAMAQGVVPVVTRVGGLPELVEHNVSGLVVPPGDTPALRDALATLLRDPARRRQLAAAARERVNGPFHFRHTVEKHLALYRRLLDQPNPSDNAPASLTPT